MHKSKKSSQITSEEEFILPLEVFQGMGSMGSHEDHILDQKGFIIIDKDISKTSLSQSYKKLLALHFNTQFKDPIHIIINSPGGHCDAGWAFIDLMAFVKNKIVTIAMGEIASMAANIFIAGDERILTPNCSTMIHQFSDFGQGNYGDLVAKTKMWELEYQRSITHLLKFSKYKTKEQIEKHLLKQNDNWLSPLDMKQHGLCDKVFVPRPRGSRT